MQDAQTRRAQDGIAGFGAGSFCDERWASAFCNLSARVARVCGVQTAEDLLPPAPAPPSSPPSSNNEPYALHVDGGGTPANNDLPAAHTRSAANPEPSARAV